MADKNNDTLLGRQVQYDDQYSPQLLCAIERQQSRSGLGITVRQLPFKGVDIWNAYELSWLNVKGLPQVALAEFHIPCTSPNIVESKSFKLYLNSFNQSCFDNSNSVRKLLAQDLSVCAGANVSVFIRSLDSANTGFNSLPGESLDAQDIGISQYHPERSLLTVTAGDEVKQQLHSHLLRSLCPVTGQPDWGSLLIDYSGQAIERSGLLQYIVGYRQHQEFHEQCVERIFCDIMSRCQPRKLSVYARYVRRGGLDINPFRSTNDNLPGNFRLIRQ